MSKLIGNDGIVMPDLVGTDRPTNVWIGRLWICPTTGKLWEVTKADLPDIKTMVIEGMPHEGDKGALALRCECGGYVFVSKVDNKLVHINK